MTHPSGTDRAWSLPSRSAFTLATSALLAVVAAAVVWFFGYDLVWSVAAVLVVGPIVALLSSWRSDDDAVWEPIARETPRGTRLTVATIEASLAACDRLGQPPVLRWLRARLVAERDDRLARLTLMRQLRAVLVVELQHHGMAITNIDAIAARVGPEALQILEPHDDHPITAANIAQCLDGLERLGAAPEQS